MATLTTKQAFSIKIHEQTFVVEPAHGLTADNEFVVQIDTLEDAERFEQTANRLQLTWAESHDSDWEALRVYDVEEWVSTL